MNKKILIGSIIAITVLIGVSFTSVIGYNSIKSSVKESPLFNIRSSRAIDKESDELSCAYVGKGNNINLLIPNRDNRIEVALKVMDKIRVMDKAIFDRFKGSVINHLQQESNFNEVTINEAIAVFEQLRIGSINQINPKRLINNNSEYRYQTWPGTMCDTCVCRPPIISLFIIGCYLIAILLIFAWVTALILTVQVPVFTCGG